MSNEMNERVDEITSVRVNEKVNVRVNIGVKYIINISLRGRLLARPPGT